MKLDIEALRTLMAIQNAGGFAAAAARLHLTQPAVSHKLRRLEERIGRKLMRRGKGAPCLTAAGIELVAYAQRIVTLHDEAAQSMSRGTYSGSIALGLTENLVSSEFTNLLGQFSRLYPDVEIRARVDQSKALAKELQSGELDLAILQVFVDQVRPADVCLSKEHLRWVASADLDVEVSDKIPFISFDTDCFYRAWAETSLRSSGRRLKIVLQCASLAGVTSAVHAGLGIALLPESKMTAAMRQISDLPRPQRVANIIRTADFRPPDHIAALRKLCGAVK